MKKHFVTFASQDLERTLSRIKTQASAIEAFDSIHCFTEDMLDITFRHYFSRQLRFGTRGYGYWCWKPQILLQTISEAEEGDIILYCDAGCEINAHGVDVLDEYFSQAAESDDGFVVFQLDAKQDSPDQFMEKYWTKEDLFIHFHVAKNDPIRNSNQICSGIFLFRVDETSKTLIREWLNVYYTNFDLVTDKPSRIRTDGRFNEHRHDQSIFSILIKQRSVKVRRFSELESSYVMKDGLSRIQPIVAARNKQFPFLTRKKRQLGKFARKLRRILAQ